jgi:hypothetical protein
LNFTYANGAVFNSLESFNGNSMNPLYRVNNQGMISEFISKGGSGGSCTCYEPYSSGISNSSFYFPAYAMGYGMVDAAYMGISRLGWKNIVIGDPLTAIAWGPQTLTKNETWSGKNLVTGLINIPMGKKITLQNNSTIKLRHNGSISGQGKIYAGDNITLDANNDWSKSLLATTKNGHPHLIWAPYPGPSITQYKIYRYMGSQIWFYIGSSSGSTFTDENIYDENDSANYYMGWTYRITAVNSQNVESTPSNEATDYVYLPMEYQKKEFGQKQRANRA